MSKNWPIGKVAAIMPSVPAHLQTPAVQDAYDARLEANLTGTCPACGATAQLPNRRARRAAKARGEPAHATMEHESDCPVGDTVFRRLLTAGMN